ncbi:MAG: hypothetical protein ACC661_07270, partial [Verrucomicrobiales bacterium]
MRFFIPAVFLSAFLLFQVQPVIARYILPWFGGGPGVWTTCMLCFQVGLLGGYAYAHLIAMHLNPRRQVVVHAGLLALSLVLLPITPTEPTTLGHPVLEIVLLLSATVGVPYLLISASGPLLQSWSARVDTGRSPYRLYAISNAGSLLGLLAYPFFFEPRFKLTEQTWIWSACYVLFVILVTLCGRKLWVAAAAGEVMVPSRSATSLGDGKEEARPVAALDRVLWVALAACASTLLLATTNQICQNVAVVPLLWILPLSLYLLSFIITFDHDRWYRRQFWFPFTGVAVAIVVWLLLQDYENQVVHIWYQVALYGAMLFGCCMVCHGELVRLRPATRYLTSFYLMVALGGALGGVFVSLVAPGIFDGFWELHAGLLGTFLAAGAVILRERERITRPGMRWLAASAGALAFLTLAGFLALHISIHRDGSIDSRRSFYGVLNVYRDTPGTESESLLLNHGRINHGKQFLEERYANLPTAYYAYGSGIGVAIRHHPNRWGLPDGEGRPLEVGVVGLGTGTLPA